MCVQIFNKNLFGGREGEEGCVCDAYLLDLMKVALSVGLMACGMAAQWVAALDP